VDQAALSCADGNHVSSLADSRIPAETTWVLGYYWRRGWSGFAPANPDGKRADSCEQHPFARAAGGELAVNDTTVTYIIGTNGRVKNIAVVASSGTPDLDRQVANCVSAWRFFPIYRDGDAVEVERNFTVNWQVE
jgi:TonB family protein